MANRCTLHKTKLNEFKNYLNSKGIAYRDGKGDYQVLQVQTGDGWQSVYEKNNMPEHFSVQDKLMPTVRKFLTDQSKNTHVEIRDGLGMGPPNPPACRHGRVMNRFKTCPDCFKEDKEIQSLVHPLIDEYWESKGEKDLYHIVFRAYHMGMRNEHNQ